MAEQKSTHSRDASEYEFDVCLSFAGEQRRYVRRVAALLKKNGVRVFYDEYLQAALWGKDLYTHLSDVYQNAARFCVLFASREYKEKVWTSHERQSAQARAINENREYILPARFDDTEIPGLLNTVGHVDLRSTTPAKLAKLIREKVELSSTDRQRRNHVPEPVSDVVGPSVHGQSAPIVVLQPSLTIEQARLEIRDDKGIILLAVKNLGDVEALAVRQQFTFPMAIVQGKGPARYVPPPFIKPVFKGGYNAIANAPFNLLRDEPIYVGSNPFPTDQTKKVLAGTIFLYAYYYATYQDAAGNDYWMEYYAHYDHRVDLFKRFPSHNGRGKGKNQNEPHGLFQP